VIASLLAYYTIKAIRLSDSLFDNNDEFSIKPYYLILFFIFFLMTFLGIIVGDGSYEDWAKHRSVILSLAENPIDPGLDHFIHPKVSQFRESRLIYYYAMHLPPAYVSGIIIWLFNITYTPILSYISGMTYALYLFTGLLIISILLPSAVQKFFKIHNNEIGVFYLFPIAISGLNYYRAVYDTGFLFHYNVEWLGFWHAQVPSMIHAWKYMPSQVIAMFAGVIIIFLCIRSENIYPLILASIYMVSSATFMWVVLIPITLFAYLESFSVKTIVKRIVDNKEMLLMLVIVTSMIFMFYFTKKHDSIVLSRTFEKPDYPIRFIKHLIVEVSWIFFFIIILRIENIKIPGIVCLCVLLIPPLFLCEIGFLNDLAMKGIMPIQLIIALFMGINSEKFLYSGKKITLILVILYFIITFPMIINEQLAWIGRDHIWLRDKMVFLMQYAGNPRMDYII